MQGKRTRGTRRGDVLIPTLPTKGVATGDGLQDWVGGVTKSTTRVVVVKRDQLTLTSFATKRGRRRVWNGSSGSGSSVDYQLVRSRYIQGIQRSVTIVKIIGIRKTVRTVAVQGRLVMNRCPRDDIGVTRCQARAHGKGQTVLPGKDESRQQGSSFTTHG